jgi:hypothetical protein
VTTPSPVKLSGLPVGRLTLPDTARPKPLMTSSLRLKNGTATLEERRRSPIPVGLTGPSVPIARRLSEDCQATNGTATETSNTLKKPIPAMPVSSSLAATALMRWELVLLTSTSGSSAMLVKRPNVGERSAMISDFCTITRSRGAAEGRKI